MRILSLTALALTLSACSDGSSHSSSAPKVETRPALELSFSEPPMDMTNINADFAADVPYSDAERNLFDVFLPDCADPTPLVIYIHGGSFTGGDKSAAYEYHDDDIHEFLQNCVAFATINYTLLVVPDEGEDLQAAVDQGGVLTSLQDTARALQFMRYHFESLNIDVENVATYGASAGASASLWLGTHDEMADSASEDPILRESTRVKAVGAIATQATMDALDWEDILFPIIEPFAPILGGTDVPTVVTAVGAENFLLTIMGTDSIDKLESPEVSEYRANIDSLELMDSGDAPIYTENYEQNTDNLLNTLLHHGLHAIAVKERADEVGLESVAYSREPAYPLEDPSGETLASFLMRHIM